MYTVVVADDEEELRRAIIRRIDWEGIGFQVVGEAENGIDALELVEKLEPDLLLTDIRMPFVTGIELARQVREIRPATHIAFLSGFDDFSYAQQAIQYNIISYLLKPISMAELTKELISVKERMDGIFREFEARHREQTDEGRFFIPLLLDEFQGGFSEEKEALLRKQAVECGLLSEEMSRLSYAVMTVGFYDENGCNRTARGQVHSVDIVLNKYLKHVSFYVEGRVVALLAGTQTSLEKYLHIAVDEVIQNTERILNMHCLVGVSSRIESLSFCHEAYCEAVNAGSYDRKTKSSVHFAADEECARVLDTDYILNAVKEAENLIRGGQEAEIKEYIKALFAELREKQTSRAGINFLVVQLLAGVCRLIFSVTEGEEQDYTMMQQMAFFAGSLEEVEKRITEFCLRVREMITNQRRKSGMVLCDKTMQIIETMYGNPDMTLNYVSGQIGVSPNYLSALIRKHTGKTFVDLLTAKRIETAKELLLCSTMKIREISEKCGYSDQHYFSYCFKKYTGLSPGAMREQA